MEPLRAPGKIVDLGWCAPLFYWTGTPWVYALEWGCVREGSEVHSLIWQAEEHEFEEVYGSDPTKLEAEFITFLNEKYDNGLFSWQTPNPDYIVEDPETGEFKRLAEVY